MRFFPGEPDRLVRVKTYFVPITTPFVPWPHAFGTRVWDVKDGDDDPDIGELNSPRPWYGGEVPATAGSSGICGTREQWQQGCGPDDPVPPPWPGSAVCGKCGPPRLLAIGGSGTGAPEEDTSTCCRRMGTATKVYAQYLGPTVYANLPLGTVVELNAVPAICFPGSYEVPAFESVTMDWGTTTGKLQFFCSGSFPTNPRPHQLYWTDCTTFGYLGDIQVSKTCTPFTVQVNFFLGPPPAVPISSATWQVTTDAP